MEVNDQLQIGITLFLGNKILSTIQKPGLALGNGRVTVKRGNCLFLYMDTRISTPDANIVV